MEGLTRGYSSTPIRVRKRRELSEDPFREIRASLVDRIERLNHRIEKLERELAQLADRGGGLRYRAASIVDGLLGGARREIAVLESSLRRMAINEFDCCMTCGATISLVQLTMFPYSVNCGECSAGFPLDYADKLHAQHLQMQNSLKALGGLIESVRLGCYKGEVLGPDWAAALIVLADLNRDLPEHFALEEQDGHLASAVSVAPRFHRKAAHLLAQHSGFCVRLTSLLSQAQQAGASVESWAQVQQDFFRLSAALHEHEKAESDLIGRAHCDDIGSPG
jgi:RNA polymerase-binding transcription factor DksA